MTEKCAICLEEMCSDLGAPVPCGHVYHRSCFETLKADTQSNDSEHRRPRCPCCEKKVKKFHKIYMTVTSPNVSLDARKSDRALMMLTRENIRLQKRLRDLKTISKDQGDFLFRILPRYDEMEAKYERLKLEKRDLQKQLDSVDEETVEIVSQWNHVEMQLSSIKTEQRELELKLEEAGAENRDLHAIWDSLEERLQRYLRTNTKAKTRKTELKKARIQVSTMRRQEEILNSKLKESQRK